MSSTKPAKILIVDDEPHIVVAIEYLMRQKGFQVASAYDGKEALEKIKGFQPQIVILDVMMPGMDGFEVARRIRRQDEGDEPLIIFLTAKGAPSDKEEGYSSGGEVYLTKPFDNDELIQIVNEAVEFG